ncbi:MAG: ergothioneine biosynthesis protein EgtB [Rhodocyclaceae bacterium]|nr:ergothioneine biosynthesis protein EgtB [Rhodocyclaceae bacterium]MBX3667586.1 ergothioneine biosynthesis protein EgtB [Rhodocyclaceae bacterium]
MQRDQLIQCGPAASLAHDYATVRVTSARLAASLTPEDMCVQSMPDASPAKWHLAHTTWFFEAVVLLPHLPGYRAFDERYFYLFNSYYEALGARHPRPERGLLTRPTLLQVLAYRAHVDAAMTRLLQDDLAPALAALIVLGLNHEQQHQELLLTDIKHLFSRSVLLPAYAAHLPAPEQSPAALEWVDFPGGSTEIGHRGTDFAFDNETPRHPVLLAPYQLASRPVSCGEFLEFMADGGYRRPEFWLSDGWAAVSTQAWQAPFYWRLADDGCWRVFTLHGEIELDAAAPVCHLSFYEAAAYAEWANARLPTEFEWEAAAATLAPQGRFADSAWLHPAAAPGGGLQQMYGDVWEWTRSSYDPYPGFRPLAGAVGEYNGKFMVGQIVLRGGSIATPPGHIRATYRNFFPPAARWQFSGLRLARDA